MGSTFEYLFSSNSISFLLETVIMFSSWNRSRLRLKHLDADGHGLRLLLNIVVLSRRPVNATCPKYDTRIDGMLWRPVNTGSVYRASVLTGHVGNVFCQYTWTWVFGIHYPCSRAVDAARVDACSVLHTSCVYGPCSRAVFTGSVNRYQW